MPEVLPSEHLLDPTSFGLTGTLTAITSPDQLSRRFATCVNFGGIQLVWHLTELSNHENSQTPLDVKPTNRYESEKEADPNRMRGRLATGMLFSHSVSC